MGFKPYSRTAIAACGVGAAVLAAALTGPGVAPALAGTPATQQTAGTASATATSYKINPTEASLSIGITFGISLAGYTNQVSQAESRGIDLGIIGTTLAAQGCSGGDPTLAADKQPQPLRSDSRDGKPGTQSAPEQFDGQTVPIITKSTQANATPYAEANTTTASLTGQGAFASIEGAHSRAVTQVTQGTRDALATVDLGSINIAGVVALDNLHWEAQYQTGAVDKTVGSFTIGSLKVLGQSLPTQDPTSALEGANALLAPLGLQFIAPRAHTDAGILFVDPLMLRVIPSPTRDGVTGAILSGVQPVRQNLYTALLGASCSFASPITVSDIVLGSVTGAGSFSLEFGGVNAKADALKTTNLLQGLPSLSNAVGGSDLGGFTAFDSNNTISALPSVPHTTVLNDSKGHGPSLAATEKGSRGGKMALVGLLGLLGLLLFAERDRRMMRHAQRIS
ncbi:MAG: hypothetical protein QOG90_867 [Actinomycetota bacterium]|jgi:hypothetical protein